MNRKTKWSRRMSFVSKNDRYTMIESLFGCSSGTTFDVELNLPDITWPSEKRLKELGPDLLISLVEHIRSPKDGSVHFFRFEGCGRIFQHRKFRGEYDFIRKQGWIQYRDLA